MSHPDNSWQALADGVRTRRYPLRFMGMQLGRRVTVLDTAPGEVVVHSTAPFTAADVTAIRQHGRVRAVVEATSLHDTFSRQGQAAFPEVPYLVPGGFPRKAQGAQARPLAGGADLLGDGLRVQRLGGMRSIEEWAVFHPASRTLVVADLLFNLPHATGWTRWALRWLAGIKRYPAIDRPFRMAIRDRKAFNASLENILGWDFDRVIVAHGEIIPTGGREALHEAASRAGFDVTLPPVATSD